MDKNSPPQNQTPANNTPPHVPNEQHPHPPVVYVTRPVEPHAPILTEKVRKRSEESKAKFPFLHLSEGEYVIFGIHRHYIGLLEIWAFVILLAALLLFALTFYAANPKFFADLLLTTPEQIPSAALLSVPVLAVIGLFGIGGWIATYVYLGNRFYLTNESVVQIIRTSLFSTKEQTISLGNVEDASYDQNGILQFILNYGSIRLSTEGEETTYHFTYAPNPKPEIAKLNAAVEAFKMGRPVDPDES